MSTLIGLSGWHTIDALFTGNLSVFRDELLAHILRCVLRLMPSEKNVMKSIASKILPVAAVVATFFALGGVARADALPPDSCASLSDVGSVCSNAGPSADEPGLCVAETCHSPSPPDGGSDYPCALCEVPDGGPPTSSDAGSDAGPTTDAGSSTDAGGATTVRDDAGTTSSPSSDSGGCSTSPDSSDSATGLAMLGLGFLGLVFSRKKRA